MSPRFSALDLAVVLAYLFCAIVVGGAFYRSQRTLRDYFLAGRSMNFVLVALSIFSTGCSAIGFIGSPAVVYKQNLLLFSAMFNMPAVALVLMTVIMPFFYKLELYTAYQYLEKRFDAKTRMMAAGLFLFMRGFLTATGIYATAIVLSETLAINLAWTILAIGAVATAYTALGGMKAVVINDNIAFFVMNVGAIIALVSIINHIDGGLSAAIKQASEAGHLRLFDWSFHLYGESYDSWNCIIGLFFANMVMFGVDQTIIQRNLTSRTEAENKRAIMMTPVVCILFSGLFYVIGAALFVYYRQNPEEVGPNAEADRIFVQYLLTNMPAGLRGLLIAAILAAALSTIDAALNSLATVTIIDLIHCFRRRENKEDVSVGAARTLTAFWGVFSTGVGLWWVSMGGLKSVLENAINVGIFFGGPLLGVFMAGMLFRGFSANGAFFGSIVGVLAVSWTALSPKVSQACGLSLPAWLELTAGIHSFWYGAIGFAVTWLAGSVISAFGRPVPEERIKGLVMGALISKREA